MDFEFTELPHQEGAVMRTLDITAHALLAIVRRKAS